MSPVPKIRLVAARDVRSLPQIDGADWQTHAACRGMDAELFFPERTDHCTEEARAVCRDCPVTDQCLDYALKHNIKHGVWGGLAERTRRGLRRDEAMALADRIVAVMRPGATYSVKHVSSLLGIQYHSTTVGAMLRLENEGRVVCVQKFRSSQYPSLYKLCGAVPSD